jgi:hypothetical protein
VSGILWRRKALELVLRKFSLAVLFCLFLFVFVGRVCRAPFVLLSHCCCSSTTAAALGGRLGPNIEQFLLLSHNHERDDVGPACESLLSFSYADIYAIYVN